VANDEPPVRQPGFRPQENRPYPSEQTEPTASRISVDVSPRNVRLQPGEVVTAAMKVRNMGAVVDEITLTPRGGASSWITVAPDTLNIFPSTEGEATIRFAPARAPRPQAGLFDYEIAVNSDRQPASSMVFRGSVELGAYDNLTAAATGTTFLTGRRESILPIKIRNLGNRLTNVTVAAADLPGANVNLSASQFALEPGGEATVWATIRARSGFLTGAPRQHPFTISVSSDYSAPLTIDGRMEQTSRFGRRSLTSIVAIAAGVAIVGGAVAANAAGLIHFGPTASSTATPGQTSSLLPSFPATPTLATPAIPTDTLGIPTDSPVVPPTPTQGGGEVTPPPQGPTPTPAGPTASPSPTANPYAGWEDLGPEQFSKGPALTSWGVGQLDIFAPSKSDGTLLHNGFSGAWSGWGQQQPLSSTLLRPAAVSNRLGHIDLFATQPQFEGGSGNVGWQTFDTPPGADAGAWGPWSELQPWIFNSGPAVSSWGAPRIDIFGRGNDGFLYHNWTDDGVNWNFWEAPRPNETGEPITIVNAPAAVAWGREIAGALQINIFYLQSDDHIHWLRYDERFGWQDFGTVGANTVAFNSAPAVTSWNANEFDVFARAGDGTLRRANWNGLQWSKWEKLTTFKIGTAPGAVSWGSGRIDVAVVDTNGGMHHSWLENGVWNPAP
jgi:hypothetical protein